MIQSIEGEDSFQSTVLQSKLPILVDFWAKWCPPCKGFTPVFEAAAKQHTDMAFCRVDTDELKELKEAFEVKSIPTLVIIRERTVVASQPGYMTKAVLGELLEKAKGLDMDDLRKQVAAVSDKSL